MVKTTTLRVKSIKSEDILMVIIIRMAMIVKVIMKVIHIHLKLENVKKVIFYMSAKFARRKYLTKVKNGCRCISNKQINKKGGYMIPI